MLSESALEELMQSASPIWLIRASTKASNSPVYTLMVQSFGYEDEYSEIRAIKIALCQKDVICKHEDGTVYFKNRTIVDKPEFVYLYNTFQVVVNKRQKRIKFGPSGNILISSEELRGLGIGSYCMSKLVGFLQLKYPDYHIFSGSLSHVDARTLAEQAQRDNFYKNRGFEVLVNDKGIGKFSASSPMQLSTKFNSEKIFEMGQLYLLNKINELNDENDSQAKIIVLQREELEREKANYQKLTNINKYYHNFTLLIVFLIASSIVYYFPYH